MVKKQIFNYPDLPIPPFVDERPVNFINHAPKNWSAYTTLSILEVNALRFGIDPDSVRDPKNSQRARWDNRKIIAWNESNEEIKRAILAKKIKIVNNGSPEGIVDVATINENTLIDAADANIYFEERYDVPKLKIQDERERVRKYAEACTKKRLNEFYSVHKSQNHIKNFIYEYIFNKKIQWDEIEKISIEKAVNLILYNSAEYRAVVQLPNQMVELFKKTGTADYMRLIKELMRATNTGLIRKAINSNEMATEKTIIYFKDIYKYICKKRFEKPKSDQDFESFFNPQENHAKKKIPQNEKHERWQQEANIIFQENSTLKKLAIAQQILNKLKNSAPCFVVNSRTGNLVAIDTIVRHIVMPNMRRIK